MTSDKTVWHRASYNFEAPDYSDGPRDGVMSELEDFCDLEARTYVADRDLDDAVAFLSETSRAR